MSGPQEINVTVGFYANQRSSKQLLSVLLSEVGEDIKSFRAILLWSKCFKLQYRGIVEPD